MCLDAPNLFKIFLIPSPKNFGKKNSCLSSLTGIIEFFDK